MQLNPEQAGVLLAYLEDRFEQLEDIYHDHGYRMIRADDALDELCEIRDGVAGSAFGKVDAEMFLEAIEKAGDLDRPDIIEKLKEVINA